MFLLYVHDLILNPLHESLKLGVTLCESGIFYVAFKYIKHVLMGRFCAVELRRYDARGYDESVHVCKPSMISLTGRLLRVISRS